MKPNVLKAKWRKDMEDGRREEDLDEERLDEKEEKK